MPRTYKFRELVKALRSYDSRFMVYENRGKGSERMIYHPDIDGRPESFPVKCHGEGTQIPKGIISGIIRRFKLPAGVL
jgi:predicted RNA binding protein YcfA (HicA-like mRNA interferase family)